MSEATSYSKDTFNRRLKKYGIHNFVMPNASEDELSIMKYFLDGETLENYYKKLILAS